MKIVVTYYFNGDFPVRNVSLPEGNDVYNEINEIPQDITYNHRKIYQGIVALLIALKYSNLRYGDILRQFTCVVADSAAPSTGPASACVAAQQAEDMGNFGETTGI
jgi:hypothetical protein